MAETGDLELESRGFEAVWEWWVGSHGVCDDIAVFYLESAPEDTMQSRHIPRMSNVLLTGLQFNRVYLSVTHQRQKTSSSHLGASPVSDALRNKSAQVAIDEVY